MSPNDVNHWNVGRCGPSDYKGPFDPEEYPLGCKFDPSDVELLGHLGRQVNPKEDNPAHKNMGTYIVTLENLCQVHPDELPGMTKDGYARHFFYPPTKTYNVGEKRKVAIGLDSKSSRAGWCKSGKTLIVNDLNKKQIGCKKIFVLHNRKSKKRKGTYGSAKEDEETKTQWVLHQLQLGSEEEEHAYVVCKVIWQLKPRTMKHEPGVETEYHLSDPSPPAALPEPKIDPKATACDPPPPRTDKFVSAEIPVVGGLRKEGSAFRVLQSNKRMRPMTQPWPFQGLAAIPAVGMGGVGMVSYPGVPIQSVVRAPYVNAMQIQSFDTVAGAAKAAIQSAMGMGTGMGVGVGVGVGMGAIRPLNLPQTQCGEDHDQRVSEHPHIELQVLGGGDPRLAQPSPAAEDQQRMGSSPEVVDRAEEVHAPSEECSEPEVVVTSQGLTAMLMCSETPPEGEEQQGLGGGAPQQEDQRGQSDAQNSGLKVMAAVHHKDLKPASQEEVQFLKSGGGDAQEREGWREEAGGRDGDLGREGGVDGGRDSFILDTFLRSTPDSGPSHHPSSYADADVAPIGNDKCFTRPENGIPNACADQRESSGVQTQLGGSQMKSGCVEGPDSEEIQKFMREELDAAIEPDRRMQTPPSALDSLGMLAEAGEKAEMAAEAATQEKPKQKRSKVVANKNGGRGEERKNRTKSSFASLLTR